MPIIIHFKRKHKNKMLNLCHASKLKMCLLLYTSFICSYLRISGQQSSIQNAVFNSSNQSIFSPGSATSLHRRYNLFQDNGINSKFFTNPTINGVQCFDQKGTDIINGAIDAVNVFAEPDIPKSNQYCVGAKFDIKLGMDFDAYVDITIQGGAANVTYPAKFTFTYPNNNSFGCGDSIWIDTRAELLDNGKDLHIIDPLFEFKLGTKVKPGVYGGGQLCFFAGCTGQGSLAYPNAFSGATSGNYEGLLGGGDYDMFIINTSTGISFPWNIYNEIPTPSAIPNTTFPLTTSLIPGFEDATKITGAITNPFSNLNGLTTLMANKLINTSTTDFFNIDFDPIQFTTYLTGIPLSISSSLGPLSVDFTSISAPLSLDVNQENSFAIDPTFPIDLNLSRVLQWQEYNADGTSLIRSGNSQIITGFTMGNKIKILNYPDNATTRILPTFKINAAFNSNFKEKFGLSLELKFAEGNFNFPSFNLGTICNDLLSQLGITDQALRDIFVAACSGLADISSSGHIGFGPFGPGAWSLAEFEVDVLDNNFIMAGFNTISGTAFRLKPDSIPPLLTTRNITIELLRNDTVLQVQQLVLSASDAEGGTIEYISVTPNTFSCIDIGTTKTVQVTISDGRCNLRTLPATVTITDGTGPTARCKSGVNVYLGSNGQVSIPGNKINDNSLGNCINSYVLTSTNFNCTNVTNTSIPLVQTITDSRDRTSTCNGSIIVWDTVKPIALCKPSVTVYLDTMGKVKLTPALLDNGSSDACGILSKTLNDSLFDCLDQGTHIVTMTVKDINNNTRTCLSTVTISDNAGVAIKCPDPISVWSCEPIRLYWDNPIITDNCSSTNLLTWRTISPNPKSSGSLFNPGEGHNITYEAFEYDHPENAHGTCTQFIFVNSAGAPTMTCPSNKTVSVTPDNCNRTIVVWDLPNINVACSYTLDMISGIHYPGELRAGEFPIGTTTNTFVVTTNYSSLRDTCSFTVTVNDDQIPIINCPGNIVVQAPTNQCDAVVNYSTPTKSSTCFPGDISLIRLNGLASGLPFPIGNNTVEYRATSFFGYTSTCSFTVTVLPSLQCPRDTTINTDPNSCTAAFNYTLPGSVCGSIDVSQTDGFISGTALGVGPTVNSFTFTDENNNTSSCSFTVTVVNTNPPKINCPAHVNVNVNPVNCGATNVTYNIPYVTSACNSMYTTSRITGLASGVNYPLGNTLNTYTVIDDQGRKDTCSFTVTVKDNIAPILICLSNVVYLDPGQCTKIINYSLPSASDRCSAVTLTRTSGQASGSVFSQGDHAITYKAVDLAGNSSSCTFYVVVVDDQPPTITCPPNITVNGSYNSNGNCGSIVTFNLPVGSDNCTGSLIQRIDGPGSGAFFTPGKDTVVYKITDPTGLFSTCSVIVTVNACDEAPVAKCKEVTVYADSECKALVSAIDVDNGSMDMEDNIESYSISPEGPFSVGIHQVVLTVTDISNHQSSCNAVITVLDTIPPQLICPENMIVNTDPGKCTSIVTYTKPVGKDNCSIFGNGQISGIGPGGMFPKGITTNLFYTEDGAHLKDSCSFTITVKDLESPQILCPSNMEVHVAPGTCNAAVSYTKPLGTDNCSIYENSQISGLGPNSHFPVGITSNIFVTEDLSHLKDTCRFNILVVRDSTNWSVTSCNSYLWNGILYTASGKYIQSFLSSSGCDSVVIMDLTITISNGTKEMISACKSFYWAKNNTVYTVGGQYYNVIGCRTDTLFLSFLPVFSYYLDQDNDLYASATKDTCSLPGSGWKLGTPLVGLDCNDSNGSIHPNAADSICDGKDHDCDGRIDEDFVSINCKICVDGIITNSISSAILSGLNARNISTTSASLYWNRLAIAQSYYVQYRLDGTGGPWSDLTPVTDTFTFITGLVQNKKYNWRVRAKCGQDYSGYFTSMFSTDAVPCAEPPSGISITNLTYNSVSISWIPTPGAVSYIIEKLTNSSSPQVWTPEDTINVPAYQPSGLIPYSLYYFRVKGVCSNQVHSGYTNFQFKTLVAPIASCPGIYDTEPTNNTSNGAISITFNTPVRGQIFKAGDKDYYKFTIAKSGTIRATLKDLPADYDLKIVNSSGQVVATSSNFKKQDESIPPSGQTLQVSAGTYYAYVYGSSSTEFDNRKCYELEVILGTASFQSAEINLATRSVNPFSVKAWPIPVQNKLHLSIPGNEQRLEIKLFTVHGQLLSSTIIDSENTVVEFQTFPSGNYIIKVLGKNQTEVIKVIKE